MYPTLNSRTGRSNFPTAPQKNLSFSSFPNDLIAPGRNFYLEIAFMNYNPSLQYGSTGFMTPAGGIRLPIPKKLNENQQLVWGEASATAAVGQALKVGDGGGGGLTGVASALAGVAVNPFLFMFFQRPQYKQFSFSWTLAPNTPQESQTLISILNRMRASSLPRAIGPVYAYPQIAIIKLQPNDLFGHLRIKPCAVESVSIDHTGGATPSFFENGAPTIVNLTLNLKEIQLWDQKDYGMSGSMPAGVLGAIIGGGIGGIGGAAAGFASGAAAGNRIVPGRIGTIGGGLVGGVIGGVTGLINGSVFGGVAGGIGSGFGGP